MTVVELWKASQIPDTIEFRAAEWCGIFVLDVERSRVFHTRSQKPADFSSSFNMISPACPRIFHSEVAYEKTRSNTGALSKGNKNGPI
jgi:hypothetical protein